MKDLALIKDGVVVQVARAPLDAVSFGPAPDGQLVEFDPGVAVPGQLWNGLALSTPAAPAPTKADLAAYAVRLRWLTEVSGILFDGHPIPTDDRGKGLVNGAYQKALADPATTKRWQVSAAPIAFVTLSNAQLVALGLAAEAFVQSTFDKLDDVADGIAAGSLTTPAAIDAAFAGLTRVFTTP